MVVNASHYRRLTIKKAFDIENTLLEGDNTKQQISRQFIPRDFKGTVKSILETEAPLSEELLLKRIVSLFGWEKVTSVVQRTYEQQMYGYQKYSIIRRKGFLYLNGSPEIQFRAPGDITREIKQIAPEELATGMLEILKQNVYINVS